VRPLAATAWVLGWHLDDDERETVRVAHGHLDQTPRLLLGFGVYHNALLDQTQVGRADVADLKHQADRRRRRLRARSRDLEQAAA